MFTSLRGVTYPVPDLETARAWYQQALGHEPLHASPFAVVFQLGDTVLTLVPARHSSRPIAYWNVADADQAHHRLLEAGATSAAEVTTGVLKNRVGAVIDPFGNVLGLSSQPSTTTQPTLDDRPSESAHGVAMFRALSAVLDDEILRGPDSLAHLFVNPGIIHSLHDPKARDFICQKAPGSLEFFVARTAFFDEQIRNALLANIPQIVFLGVGYDTRPYRFHDLIQDTLLIELDTAPIQQRKRRILTEAHVTVPANLHYATINFTRDRIEDVLDAAGYNPHRETLFLWEGVIYYLPAQAVDDTLQSLRTHSAPGSTLAFDYLADAPDMPSRYGVRQSIEAMRTTYLMEPIQFRIQEGALPDFLSPRGFTLQQHLNTQDMERRYLTRADGTRAGQALASIFLATASLD